MGAQADAITDPWTVVVHFHHAPPAYAAVVRSGRLHALAAFAVPEILEVAAVLIDFNGH